MIHRFPTASVIKVQYRLLFDALPITVDGYNWIDTFEFFGLFLDKKRSFSNRELNILLEYIINASSVQCVSQIFILSKCYLLAVEQEWA